MNQSAAFEQSFPRVDSYNVADALARLEQDRSIIFDDKVRAELPMQTQDYNTNLADQLFAGILEPSLLTRTFFHPKNIDTLQHSIQYYVWEQSQQQYRIGRQHDSELVQIMRWVYLQHSKNLDTNITEQVAELNDRTLEEVVPRVLKEIALYTRMQTAFANPAPMDLPQFMQDRGDKLSRPIAPLSLDEFRTVGSYGGAF